MKRFKKVMLLPGSGVSVLEDLSFELLTRGLARLVKKMRLRHPEILDRMGDHVQSVFLIDPVDLPFVLRIQPIEFGDVNCLRRTSSIKWDARITASIATLFAMFNGTLDGDALFFSRHVMIEGSVEAVLALRNALDSAEIALASEVVSLFGPFRRIANRPVRTAVHLVERLANLALLQQGVQVR